LLVKRFDDAQAEAELDKENEDGSDEVRNFLMRDGLATNTDGAIRRRQM
jgi:hypothetical protein